MRYFTEEESADAVVESNAPARGLGAWSRAARSHGLHVLCLTVLKPVEDN